MWAQNAVAEAAKHHNAELTAATTASTAMADASVIVKKMAAATLEEMQPIVEEFMSKESVAEFMKRGYPLAKYSGKIAEWQLEVEKRMQQNVTEETVLDIEAMRREARRSQAAALQAMIGQAETEVRLKYSKTQEQLVHDAAVKVAVKEYSMKLSSKMQAAREKAFNSATESYQLYETFPQTYPARP